ncbi:MAG: hypothetical protein ACI4J6_05010 [Oscillospiraceae bacterium]
MGLFSQKQQFQISTSILPPAAKNEILAKRLPQLKTDSVFLKSGEMCSYIDKAILNSYVKKSIKQHISHSSPGLFKGTRFTTGVSKPIEYEEIVQTRGILYITNTRVVFQASQNAFDKPHKDLSAIQTYNNAVILQYGNKNYELIVPDGNLVDLVLKLVN